MFADVYTYTSTGFNHSVQALASVITAHTELYYSQQENEDIPLTRLQVIGNFLTVSQKWKSIAVRQTNKWRHSTHFVYCVEAKGYRQPCESGSLIQSLFLQEVWLFESLWEQLMQADEYACTSTDVRALARVIDASWCVRVHKYGC